MQIANVLKPSMVKLGVESRTKEELFEEMVQLFVENGLIPDRSAAVKALLEREAKMSTGIAPGFALPHGKLEGIRGVVMALGVLREGIDFESLDDEPVYVVLVLFSEAGNPGPHIEALSEVGRLLQVPGFIHKLQNAKSAEEVLAIIRAEE
ncbi:MAG: PTS sugar transporter subunit IIA [Victivallales bacterium]|nr:PTS sugar transporter subunit IIA [Victivallales bacterium]